MGAIAGMARSSGKLGIERVTAKLRDSLSCSS